MPIVDGAIHLANSGNIYEPARGNTFRFLVTDLEGLVKPGTEDTLVNAQNYLECSVVSVDLPMFSQQSIEIRRGNSVMKAAGLPTFTEGNLVIYDYIGADGKSILLAWQKLSYNVNTDTVGYMSEYKKDCYLLEYDVNFSRVLRQWLMHGCWVSSVSQDAFNKENGDKRQVTAQIQYDYAEIIEDGNE